MRKIFFIPSIFFFYSLLLNGEVLHLSKAYELALQNEPKLAAVGLRAAASSETVEQMKSKLYPQIQANASWGRYEYESDYLRSPVREDYTSYSLSANQALYRPELLRGIKESKARLSAAQFDFQAQSQQLGLDLTKAYFTLLRNERNLELKASEKAYYETKYQQLEEMLKFGLTNRIDLLETKVHLSKSISELLAEQKRTQAAKIKLQHMIGEKSFELPSFDFNLIDVSQLSMERTEWENKLPKNPTFQSYKASETMAKHQLASREYEHYPKIDLSLVRKETYTADTVAHKYDNQAIIQMSIPIYQGGITQSRIRESLLLLNAAQKEADYYNQAAQLRFEELWAEREFSMENLKTLKESETSAELYLLSVEKGYKAGLKSIVDVLEAKAKLNEIKRDIIDGGYELINNELSLLDIVGELTVDNITLYEIKLFKRGDTL